jgi:two-component system response regulator HydG
VQAEHETDAEEGIMAWSSEERIIGDSPVMRTLSARLRRVAASDMPVLIRGETGTGKELVARAIHLRSSRRRGPFVSENCAAIAEDLLEAELFGHEAGSFTGAVTSRDGLFRRAHGGTLFIDEIGDMPASMQAKLLRVLQEGEVRSVGAEETESVDVRVIAATHKDLDALVKAGKFRQDLLFRIAVLEVKVAPLRERMSDVPRLAERTLARVAIENGTPPLALTGEALDRLLAHPWPGNVRELQNAVRVGALFSSGQVLDAAALPLRGPAGRAFVPDGDADLSYEELQAELEERERSFVTATLERARGNKAEAARRLGITRYALYRTLRRLGVDPDAAPLPAASPGRRSGTRDQLRRSGSGRLEAVGVG